MRIEKMKCTIIIYRQDVLNAKYLLMKNMIITLEINV